VIMLSPGARYDTLVAIERTEVRGGGFGLCGAEAGHWMATLDGLTLEGIGQNDRVNLQSVIV